MYTNSFAAGIGCAVSYEDEGQILIPVADSVDAFLVRSNQRAEILAAIKGLE